MVERSDILVTADALSAELAGAHPPVVLDVRWTLGQSDGWDAYIAWHIHRAVYVRLDEELIDPDRPASEGARPLPRIERLQGAARDWGVNQDSRVVVYDDNRGLPAARAWWLLRYAGLADVRLLDGGMRAWTGAGLPLDTGVSIVEPGDVELRYGALPIIGIAAAAEFPEHGILLDAGQTARYVGDETADGATGHIPGAISAPTGGNLDEHGNFLPVEELRERFEALGVSGDVAVYCGSGIAAVHEAIALTLAGFRPYFYPGGMSEWVNHPERPVETGDPIE